MYIVNKGICGGRWVVHILKGFSQWEGVRNENRFDFFFINYTRRLGCSACCWAQVAYVRLFWPVPAIYIVCHGDVVARLLYRSILPW